MKLILGVLLLFTINSCVYELANEPELGTDFDFYLQNFKMLSHNQQSIINGVYKVFSDRDNNWSGSVVCKFVKNRLCIYSNEEAVFAESLGGFIGDSLVFSGIMRIIRSGEGQRIKLVVTDKNTATLLRTGKIPQKIIFNVCDINGLAFRMEYEKPLAEPNNFYVIAHRGGCRNSERIGISENSLKMIEYSEILGADGVEIDIKKTKDDKLIIFHDDTFSPRTVQGAYLLGDVSDFTYNQISTFGRLKYGEKIPTLDEALSTVIENTNLKLVWLDVKDSTKTTLLSVINSQIKFTKLASEKGRKVKILLGIPNQDILDAYNKVVSMGGVIKGTETLIELDDKQEVYKHTSCKAWAPRWTLDLDVIDILDMQGNGKDVFRWTVDLPESISNCIVKEKVNGICSNYPSLVAALKYTR